VKKTHRLSTFLVTIILVGQACDDSPRQLYDYQRIWKSHYEISWNYETTRTKIVGVWEWKYVKCCGESTKPYKNGTESKGLKIEFKDDGTGIATNHDAVEEFTWDIEIADNDLYGFETTPFISQLHGRLLFSDNIMMCNGSFIDGADNFFEKIGGQ
jgi:hypothetical protein